MTQQRLPRYILRNCMLWTDGNLQLGQLGDVSPPVPTVKTEELRNAGMPMPISVNLGYEALEFSFNMPGLDPDVLSLFGLAPGVETPFMITGATVDEDGTEHSAVLTIRGMLTAGDQGEWTPGEMASNGYTVKVRYYKLEIDDREIYEADPFDFKIGGVSQYAGIRRALMLD
jgi:P2 family phage contractile tail tube protein